MKKKWIISLVLTGLVLAGNAQALPTGAMTGWDGSVNFDETVGTTYLKGYIDYAVYEASSFGGSWTPDADYVYMYQIFNDSTSTGVIDNLSVVLQPNADLGSIDVDTSSGGISPVYSYFSPDATNTQAGVYYFLPSLPGITSDGFVDPGENSAMLFFTSDYGPQMGEGILSSLGLDVALPTVNVPEPATMALLGLGGLALFRRRSA